MDREVAGLRLQVTVPRALLVVGLLLLFVGLGLAAREAWLQYQQAVERQQVDVYTARVGPLAASAGALVQQTIVPELGDYSQGKVGAGQVAIDAAGWQADFLTTRRRFDQVPHGGPVAAAAAGFDKALIEYAEAVQMFGEAVLLPRSAQPAALGTARTAAERADKDYASAAQRLACLRKSLGLRDDPRFKASGGC